MLIAPRWRKVLRDLWRNKTRTLLVISSIAIGVFAIGTVQHLQITILNAMQQEYVLANAANAILYATGSVNGSVNGSANGIDNDTVHVLQQIANVEAVEGRSTLITKIVANPVEKRSLQLVGLPNFEEQFINKVQLDSPASLALADQPGDIQWPPGKYEVILERSSFQGDFLPADLRIGQSLPLEMPNKKVRELKVVGLAYEATAIPARLNGDAIGYISMETLELLGGSASYDQLNMTVQGDKQDKAYITEVAKRVEAKIQKGGGIVNFIFVPEPGQLPLQDVFESLGVILFPLSIATLFLSSILITNVISALLSQQIRQIGVMKAIGARAWQMMAMYIGLVTICGGLALLIAIPASLFVVRLLLGVIGNFINISFASAPLPPQVLATEIAMGVGTSFLSAIYPVWRGTRVSVREALSDYGVSNKQTGLGFFDQVLSRLRGLPRPILLSLRNTFRRRGRLVLTLLMLIVGGMIFITASSIRGSLTSSLEDALAYWQFDIQINMERPYRISQLEQIAFSVAEVVQVECWGFSDAHRIRPDETDSDSIFITALPPQTTMVQPTLLAGRWLLTEDDNAIVVNQNVIRNEPDLGVGDELRMRINSQELTWRIVGIVQVLGSDNNAYVSYSYFSRQTNTVNQASFAQITLKNHDTLHAQTAASQLEERFEQAGVRLTNVRTVAALREQNESAFTIIVSILLIMGVLIAAVGALGLMGTMSINVLERTREFAIMRSIGASNQAILQIVIVEGLIIGLFSWSLGALVAYPAGAWLTSAIGTILFQTTLHYVFAIEGLVYWLLIIVVLAVLASILPARNASRLTVRDALAYE